MELDIWMPDKNLGLEFQDSYHYINTWYSHHSLEHIQVNDKSTQKQGISLVAIPCWWNGDVESLSSSIQFHRPDVLASVTAADPIPLNPPSRAFQTLDIPDVGGLMLASFPVAPDFSDSISPNTWWIGEKYDGIRYCWNSLQENIYSKQGRLMYFPSQLKPLLPKLMSEGEFWFGRGMFFFTTMFRTSVEDIPWQFFRMIAFDCPAVDLQKHPFEQRYKCLLSSLDFSHPYNIIAPRMLCFDGKQLTVMANSIMHDEGEGVILRQQGSVYLHGRNKYLLKFKAIFRDKEGLVVGITADSVTIKLPSGTLFTIPIDKVETTIPNKGDVVTFKYSSNVRREVPDQAVITRIRHDVEWRDILLNFENETRVSTSGTQTSHPQGYWTNSNMKSFFVNIAKSFNLDPLLPSTWHSISYSCLIQNGAKSILQKFGGYYQTILTLFPNIGLKPNFELKFGSVGLWQKQTNRRQFFESYAKKNGFDPLNPKNWYTQPRRTMKKIKGVRGIIQHHGNSISKALLDLFPEIGLRKSEFATKHWTFAKNRRKLFEAFAKMNNKDHMNPESWYSVSLGQIHSISGGQSVMSYYRNDLAVALSDLFPTIGIDKTKFQAKLRWNDPKKGRQLLFNFAKADGFDALIPENWYSQNKKKLMAIKGFYRLVECYEGSIVKTLMTLLPNIGLEKSRFRGVKLKP